MNSAARKPQQEARPEVLATYRLQLSPVFTFADATRVVPYLARLGISHLYLSPVFQSRRGSPHGYDVVQPALINAELGGESGLRALAEAAHRQGLAVMVDVVPNHMAVMTPENPYWIDVLENGPAAGSARFFDIDWEPNRRSMHGRLLVPVLSAPFGEILDRGLIRVAFQRETGSFHLEYESQRLPLDLSTYPVLLDLARDAGLARNSLDEITRDEIESLGADLARLPAAAHPGQDRRQRYRDKETGKRRLMRLCERNPAVMTCIDAALNELNGKPGEAASFDRLASLLDRQPYRLAYWRVAGEEINYRRFFDVDSLAAVRVEEDSVFDAMHGTLRKLLVEGIVDGMRIDHADGLRDPCAYLSRIAALSPASRPYLAVEKILGQDESLPRDWPVDGTTGYEFAAAAGNWLLYRRGMGVLDRACRSFTGGRMNYEETEYESKQLIMRSSLAAEVTLLATRLDRLAQANRRYVDLTFFSLRAALVEMLAAFPVYRTYGGQAMNAEERRIITRARDIAISRGRANREALEYLHAVLLGEPPAVSDANAKDIAEFVARFQQVSPPVMAKSIEDTAFYRYPRLIALNEVGNSPRANGLSTARLHAANRRNSLAWPRSMLATATHDAKLGEDVRCRLYVLAELAADWAHATKRWQRLRGRSSAQDAPRRNLEYLLLQALLGSMPATEPADRDARRGYRDRIADYALKAAREAKQITSWLYPDAEVEAAIARLVDKLLPEADATGFDSYFGALLQPVAAFGMLNSLSMLVLKLTSPGIPDLYQGTELPQFVFADPDNRQPVDFGARAALLDRLQQATDAYDLKTTTVRLLHEWWTGEIKAFVLWRLLGLRNERPRVFSGKYIPLKVVGPGAEHLCAYLRRGEPAQGTCLVVVSRWLATLSQRRFPLPESEMLWNDTAIELAPALPRGEYADIFTGERFLLGIDSPMLPVSKVLTTLPVTVLQSASPEPR